MQEKRNQYNKQVGKDIKVPTIHCCRGYDSIQDENGRMGFGVYDPKEKNIYIAGDVPKEIFLKALFHEIFHWMQDVAGMKFDEDDANSFSDILYDAVDMFDDHGPELFGQKTIVEPGEVFVGENVLKEALADQFREHTKKTDFKPGDKFILELGAERKMFDEFEIAGTDLYVKISLLEKLTRYEPEKFEIHNDHTDCIWYHYLDDDDDVPNTCPSTCSQYRDGWNDAMKYIYCDGKGYQPYKRKAK